MGGTSRLCAASSSRTPPIAVITTCPVTIPAAVSSAAPAITPMAISTRCHGLA
jgi:hypothetical protein